MLNADTGEDEHTSGITTVDRLPYHGWPDAIRLSNPQAEVVVVPALNRIMSFRLRGEENVLWEDRQLDGIVPDGKSDAWLNFGGDKAWPAPESDWARMTGSTQWMPPAGFDGLPAEATVIGESVELRSPIDLHYGLRVLRRIALDGTRLRVLTRYERLRGDARPVGVWVISQFRDPIAVVLRIPPDSRFRDGHFRFDEAPWPQLLRKGDYLVGARDRLAPHKLGSDASALLWIGERETCLITVSGDRPAGDYPDGGARTEFFTSADPKAYVELETLGPLVGLGPGEWTELSQDYRLARRRSSRHEDEFALLPQRTDAPQAGTPQ